MKYYWKVQIVPSITLPKINICINDVNGTKFSFSRRGNRSCREIRFNYIGHQQGLVRGKIHKISHMDRYTCWDVKAFGMNWQSIHCGAWLLYAGRQKRRNLQGWKALATTALCLETSWSIRSADGVPHDKNVLGKRMNAGKLGVCVLPDIPVWRNLLPTGSRSDGRRFRSAMVLCVNTEQMKQLHICVSSSVTWRKRQLSEKPIPSQLKAQKVS